MGIDFQVDTTSTSTSTSTSTGTSSSTSMSTRAWQYYDLDLRSFHVVATNQHYVVFVLLSVLLLLLLLLMITLLWIGFQSATSSKKPQKTTTNSKETSHFLNDWIVSNLQQEQETILLIDSNNVRGKCGFIGHSKLLAHLIHQCQKIMRNCNDDVSDDLKGHSMDERALPHRPQLSLIYVMDHGCQPASRMMKFPFGISILFVWAGPDRTADDVVVQATRAYLRQHTNTSLLGNDATTKRNIVTNKNAGQLIIVTSDQDLKHRCLAAASKNSNTSVIKQGRRKRTNHKMNTASRDWSVRVASSVDFWTSCMGDIQESAKECRDDTVETSAPHEPFGKEVPCWDKLCKLEEELHSFAVLHNYPTPTSKTCPTSTVLVEQTWQRVVIAEAMRQCIFSDTVPTSVQKSNSSASTVSRNRANLTSSLFLRDFQDYYIGRQQSQQCKFLHKPTETVTESNLLEDHRICAIPNQKQRLLHYLNSSE